MANVGDASTVKVTVIGRPTQVVERQGGGAVALRSTNTATNHRVFIAQKQWNKVREVMQHADDALIMEGYPVHAARFVGIAVYAT